MTVALIISTYNWPQALESSIRSALQQSRPPDEIIIADDGSSADTAQLVQHLQAEAKIPLVHSWQEDRGFRAAMSRNKAIAKARSNYIILIDGDIILDKNFISDHLAWAQKDQFVQGARVLVGSAMTRSLLDKKHNTIKIFNSGIENRKNCIRSKLLAKIFSSRNRKLGGIRTCNFAFWKKDAINVNGFNEDFIGWGREDSEFAARLFNNGLQRLTLRFMGLAYHLDHSHNSTASLEKNDAILQKTISASLSWCNNGLDKYLSGTPKTVA